MKYNFILFVFIVILLSGCNEKATLPQLNLTPNPVLSAIARWGVVQDRYILVYKEPGINDSIIVAIRRGDMVEVINKEEDSLTNLLWFKINNEEINGWILADGLTLYDSEEKAKTASEDFIVWK